MLINYVQIARGQLLENIDRSGSAISNYFKPSLGISVITKDHGNTWNERNIEIHIWIHEIILSHLSITSSHFSHILPQNKILKRFNNPGQ